MNTLSQKNIWHIIIGGAIGNLSEWYNFLLYGYLASTISQLFFPTHNQLISLSLTFTVFALSFFVRPFGGILFGWIGDTYGRQRALIISLVMMAIPTFLIGCLPTYQSIGILSPVLLLILRIIQGLSAGGEHTGSAVYIAEFAPSSRRTLWVSIIPMTAALGILMSSLIALILIKSLSHIQLLTWGWRLGYGIGTFLCVISIFLRITLPETPYFKKELKEHPVKRYPIKILFTKPDIIKNLLTVIVLSGSWGVFYQILFVWMPTYLTQIQHFSNSTALVINSSLILLFACLILFVGFIADYLDHKSMLIISNIAMILLAYPLFTALSSGALFKIIISLGIFTLIFSLYLPVAFVTMIELFHTDIRYTGLSFGFNLGLAIFGGTCPLIATWLIEITHNKSAPALYMMIAAAFALIISTRISNKEIYL